jgi:hypothetical protein
MAAQVDDLSCSLVTLEQDTSLITVVELSRSSWLAGAIAPGLRRQAAENSLNWIQPNTRSQREGSRPAGTVQLRRREAFLDGPGAGPPPSPGNPRPWMSLT